MVEAISTHLPPPGVCFAILLLPWLAIIKVLPIPPPSLASRRFCNDTVTFPISTCRMMHSPPLRRFSRTLAAIVLFASTIHSVSGQDAILKKGEAIYRNSCVDCHGEMGIGVEGAYEKPLVGDSSIGELTKVIDSTMPEGDADNCKGPDAAAVATYIHDTFYSEAARLRLRPPQIALARLTAEQLRQSLSDLYAHFDGGSYSDERGGFRGEYFTTTRRKAENRKIDRIDQVIDFDFKKESPGEGISANEFTIQWAGSVHVDQSGEYEIILRSSCSCMMYFGATDRILFNNHVQSEGKTEFRETLRLTAGRSYPIKIEFTQRKRKTEQPPASISLSWRTPSGREEFIPGRLVVPKWNPPQFALQTQLPPDDRSYGYQRGINVGRQWDESTTLAAIEFGEVAATELWPRYRRRNRNEPNDQRQLLKKFLGELIRVAHRGVINDQQKERYIDRQLAQVDDDAQAIKRVSLLALKSPRFLYPALDSGYSKSQRLANRVSLILLDSLPAGMPMNLRIENNQLDSEGQIQGWVETMAKDRRATNKLRHFIHHWLDLDDVSDLSKNEERFVGFDQSLLSDLELSFESTLEQVLSSESCDFRELLSSQQVYTTKRLEQFYGEDWRSASESTEYTTLSVKSDRRAGLLTHPLLMSKLAGYEQSSPIHRGVALYRKVLGRNLRPPNAAFTPFNEDLHPSLTTRERIELQTGSKECQVCHSKINSLGFVLENFDAAGRYRMMEKGKSIDASGSYVDRDGRANEFAGADDLAQYLVQSDDCQRAFVESAFEYFVKQPIGAYGADATEKLTASFADNEFNIRKLMRDIATHAAMFEINVIEK